MPGSGKNLGWSVDGVSVGSDPEVAPETALETSSDAAGEHALGESTPPHGVPAATVPAYGPDAGGRAPSGGKVPGSVAARTATATPPDATGTVAPSDAAPVVSGARERRRRWPIAVLAVLVLVGILLVIKFAFLSGAPSYKVVHGTTAYPLGTNVVDVAFSLANTGTAAGAPTCTVRVSTRAGIHSAHGTFKERSLQPGKGAIVINELNVARTTAQLVTASAKIDITCS